MAQLNLEGNLPSPSTSYYNVYDVFINHRGPDVKKTLATDLYNCLHRHGLRVFLDVNELEEGEKLTPQIEGAIRTASVHVAIFSPRYAESAWCLKELDMMLKSGSTILPIFYGVKPSELRWTHCENGLYAKVTGMLNWVLSFLWTRRENGVYAQALLKLQEKKTFDDQTQQYKPRYDTNRLQKWREALSEVADISGFDLETYNAFSVKEQLLEKVVEGVLKKVKIALHVSKYPTGLDKKVEDFERTMLSQQQNGEVRVIGIVGLSGVGKTTLAKEIFNRERSNYSRSCCLLDVREKPLITCQTIVLKDLAQFNEEIYSVDDGIEKLRRYLKSLHALIILDDVDHVHQLDALLLPMKDVLHESSLILVTCGNKDVLANSDIPDSSIHQLTGLDRQNSKELFCWHAFNKPLPVEGFEEVVEKFLCVSNGLPVSLTVLGALFRGRVELSYWKAQLLKISRRLPQDIQSRLKISYNSLDEEEKQIFLDIACFFIGKHRDTAIRIWDGSGWQGSLGFRNLENRCVVEVDIDNCIRMHGHFRDMDRDIAKKEPPHRLWRPIENLLHNLIDQSAVRGIHMVEQRSGRRFENPVELDNRFRGATELALLSAEGDCLKSIFSRVQSPQHIWLRWDSCPYYFLPPWIQMERLRVLEVKGGKLTTLWGDLNSQAPLKLRELKIIGAPLLKMPNSIGKLKHLEKFVVHNGNLKTLPDEFCHLQCLKHLELKSCSKLKSLPELFGTLTKLQHIDLSQCIKLQMLPNSFGNLEQLQHLELKSCSKMKSLPDSFGRLTNLRHIDLSQCINLEMLPKSFGNLVQLQQLYLDKCLKLTVCDKTFGKISTLQCLKISRCSNIEVVPSQVARNQSMRELILSGKRIKELPSAIVKLIHLEVLILDSQLLKKMPPSLGSLRSLQRLELSSSQLKRLPESIGNLRSLKVLRIQSLKQLECLPDSIGYLGSIQELMFSDCSQLKCLPDSIRMLTQLTKLSIKQSGVEYLPPCVMELNSLEQLEIQDCPLSELPFSKDGGERGTVMDSVSSKEDTSHVKCMIGLTYLKLGAIRISEVSFCEGVCPKLQYLEIKGCHYLVEVGALPTTPTELVLWNCVALKKIGVLAQLTRLQVLNVNGCLGLEEVQGIEHMTSLKSLNAGLCIELHWLPSLESLKSLERLEISDCCKLKRVKGLAQLTKLGTIEVAACSQLEELEGIEHSRSLKRINASACPKLQWDGEVMTQLRQRLKKGLII